MGGEKKQKKYHDETEIKEKLHGAGEDDANIFRYSHQTWF